MTEPKPLRAWLVRVRSANHKSGIDGWGDQYTFHPIENHYVLATTAVSAVFQAKRLAGFITIKDRNSRKGVLLCECIQEIL